jgi:uncharacterized protein
MPVVDLRIEELHDLCRRFHVRRLELYGSAAEGRFDPRTSDLDFLVEFEDLEPVAYADAYFGLLEALQALFGRPVDLTVASAVTNPYFLRRIADSRLTLYAAVTRPPAHPSTSSAPSGW